MANKILEKMEMIFKKHNFSPTDVQIRLQYNLIMVIYNVALRDNPSAVIYTPFDFINGFSLEHIGTPYQPRSLSGLSYRYHYDDYKEEIFPIVEDIWREVNKETALYRLLISKGITSAQVRKMYHLDKDALKPTPKAEIAAPEEDNSYPNEIRNARIYRIKINDDKTRRVCFGDKITDKGMTIKTPYDLGVKRSSEISFISEKDAMDFIKANMTYFSQWWRLKDFSIYKSKTNSFRRIKVPGTTKAYATEDFIKYLSNELGKIPPLYT